MAFINRRFSLGALLPVMRLLLDPDTKTLLLAFDTPQHEMPGPPFSIQSPVGQALYRSWCSVELLYSEDMLDHWKAFKMVPDVDSASVYASPRQTKPVDCRLARSKHKSGVTIQH